MRTETTHQEPEDAARALRHGAWGHGDISYPHAEQNPARCARCVKTKLPHNYNCKVKSGQLANHLQVVWRFVLQCKQPAKRNQANKVDEHGDDWCA
jgi:hypothetical protein